MIIRSLCFFLGKIDMKKRVAAYCRVSSKLDNQKTSINLQVNYYENLFKENSEYEVVGIFSDVKTGLRVNGGGGATQN